MYWIVLQSHVVENLPFFLYFWCFFLNIIFNQKFICFHLVHKLVQAAGLYLAKSQWNVYFVQLIMFKRRIPCLDSYLDKVSSEFILSSLCQSFLCSISIILNDTAQFMDNGQVNMSLWPRFKMVFDLHLNSLRNANIKTLWEDDVHPHYVTRRYAEFTASLAHLNVEHGDGQVS
jgi:hypothetical protein